MQRRMAEMANEALADGGRAAIVLQRVIRDEFAADNSSALVAAHESCDQISVAFGSFVNKELGAIGPALFGRDVRKP
jgi:hypothetical protein